VRGGKICSLRDGLKKRLRIQEGEILGRRSTGGVQNMNDNLEGEGGENMTKGRGGEKIEKKELD